MRRSSCSVRYTKRWTVKGSQPTWTGEEEAVVVGQAVQAENFCVANLGLTETDW